MKLTPFAAQDCTIKIRCNMKTAKISEKSSGIHTGDKKNLPSDRNKTACDKNKTKDIKIFHTRDEIFHTREKIKKPKNIFFHTQGEINYRSYEIHHTGDKKNLSCRFSRTVTTSLCLNPIKTDC
jgi:hypothetical protein